MYSVKMRLAIPFNALAYEQKLEETHFPKNKKFQKKWNLGKRYHIWPRNLLFTYLTKKGELLYTFASENENTFIYE